MYLSSVSLLLYLITIQICVHAVEYGPSLSSLTGVFVNWKGPDLLAIESGRKVKLETYPGYAAVIPLISGDSKATSEQIFQERGISTVGEFIVEAPKGYGIIVVIQELKLRKSSRDRVNNGTITCSDYIQFGENRAEGNGGVSSRICGTVNRDDLTLNPKGLLGPRTYRSTSGRMRISFNHAYVAELVDSLLGSKQKHVLKAEIAFTAYKSNCSEDSSFNSNATTTEGSVDEESFELCSDYTKSSNQTCISSKLLCDEIYNCGGDGESLGSDDNVSTCPDKPVRTTEKPPEEEEEKSDGLGNLATYLGIPSLSSFQPKKYERRFRPSYVSSSQSGSGGFGFDYSSRRSTSESSASSVASSTTEPTLPANGVNVVVSDNANTISVTNTNNADANFETEIYNRRELSHAINSVIYGVAVFIIFTIFITVFVVCITKKIQMTWSARRNSAMESNATSISTPSIIPNTTTTVITHNRNGNGVCPPSSNGDLSYSPQNTTVVLLTLPQNVESYDPPPSYETLFPASS